MPVYSYVTAKGRKWLYKVSVANRQYLKRGFATREEARKAEATFLLNAGKERRVPTLSEAAEGWLAAHGSQIKESTLYSLRGKVRNYVLDRLPDLPLDRYSYPLLSRWWEKVCSERIQKKNYVLGILKGIFAYARDFHGVDCMAVVNRLLPFRDFSIRDVRESRRFLSADEFRRVYAAEGDPYFRLYLLISFFMGMRISEVRGLQVKCYDGERLYVFQQVQGKSGKGRWELTSLKTKSSSRVYLLPPFLRKAIDAHVAANSLGKESFLFFGRSSRDRGHLEPVSENTLARELRRLSASTGIRFTSHSFRHGEATLLESEGVSVEEIGRYLGHSSGEVTRRHYIHETEKARERIAALLEEEFGKDFGQDRAGGKPEGDSGRVGGKRGRTKKEGMTPLAKKLDKR